MESFTNFTNSIRSPPLTLRIAPKSLDFLDDSLKTPLVIAEDIETIPIKKNTVESLCEYVDELFSNVFMKNFYENIKKSK